MLRQKSPVWREVLLPSLVLGTTWLIVSTATTLFIGWQERRYEQIINHEVGGLQTLERLNHEVSTLAREIAEDPAGAATGLHDGLSSVGRLAGQLRTLSTLAGKQDFVERIAVDVEALESASQPDAATGGLLRTQQQAARLVQKIADDCHALSDLVHQDVRAQQQRFNRSADVVLFVRQVVNLAGPAIGIWLGFRAAGKLRSQIAQITFKLERSGKDLGKIDLYTKDGGDLELLEGQVAKIQDRLRQTLSQLDDAQREILRGERLAAVGQLAAGVAHELRNPLTAVKLLVQTRFASNSSGAAARADSPGPAAVILEEIVRMERTIQSLLDFARPPRQFRVRHDVRDVFSRVLQLVAARAEQQRVEIELQSPSHPVEIEGDQGQLQQVLVNLALNGIDAMPGGGRLVLSLQDSAREDDPPAGHDCCVIHVEDCGPGIPDEVLARLFEPFVTSKERGTGLGLAVSRRIIDEHGGTLSAGNLRGGGARFTVVLPLAAAVST